MIGFRASDIGQYGIADGTWWQGGGDSFDPWAVGGGESPFYDDWLFDLPVADLLSRITNAFQPPRSSFPDVRVTPAVQPEVLFIPEASGDPEVVPEVIDPDFNPEGTVAETEEAYFEPGNEWYERTAPTNWETYYDDYVILNAPQEQEVDVAVDWGELFGTVVETYGDMQIGGPGIFGMAQSPVAAAGPAGTYGPRTVTIDTVTGKVTKCKRRRRRRLLTEGDFNDLMRIATLPNKDTVKIALAKSIGRR